MQNIDRLYYVRHLFLEKGDCPRVEGEQVLFGPRKPYTLYTMAHQGIAPSDVHERVYTLLYTRPRRFPCYSIVYRVYDLGGQL